MSPRAIYEHAHEHDHGKAKGIRRASRAMTAGSRRDMLGNAFAEMHDGRGGAHGAATVDEALTRRVQARVFT